MFRRRETMEGKSALGRMITIEGLLRNDIWPEKNSQNRHESPNAQ